MELFCELCPNFVTTSQGVKRRHKAAHKKSGLVASEGKRGQEGGQGGKGHKSDGVEGRSQAQGSGEGGQKAGCCLGIKVGCRIRLVFSF